jgi:hypothetical protein
MEIVTFEIPPFGARMRVLAVLAVGFVLQCLAVFELPWFTADGAHLALGPLGVQDVPGLSTTGGAAYYAAVIAFVVFGLRVFAGTLVLAIALVQGHPHAKRGLLDADHPSGIARWLQLTSSIRVSWLTSRRAHGFLAIYLAASVALTVIAPVVRVTGEPDAVLGLALARGAGGFVMIASVAIMHLAVFLIARDRTLAAVQLWARATPAAPAPREAPVTTAAQGRPPGRPMIKSPLPTPAPVDADPFRAPPTAGEIESRLVRPTAPLPLVPRVDDPSRPPPSLLR